MKLKNKEIVTQKKKNGKQIIEQKNKKKRNQQ